MFESTISTKIEIAAPPAEVRKRFLQFNKIPKYHPNGWIKEISPPFLDAPLKEGTILHVVVEVATMDPPILENSEKTFSWGGKGLMGTFNGNHAFHFLESQTTIGGTTFVQEEQFEGALAFMIGDGLVGSMIGFRDKTRKGFEGFNADLKKYVETRSRQYDSSDDSS